MKKFIQNNLFVIPLFFIAPIFLLFTYHSIFMGTDELRTTYVAKEIAKRGNIYFTDPNNDLYHTNIFVKNGFLINKNKIIYPFGFTINSIILVPFLFIIPNSILVFNLFAFACYLLTYIIIYQIFYKLKLKKLLAVIGALIFSITNFYLALYVSYYPDFFLLLLAFLFIYLVINFSSSPKLKYLYFLAILSSFLLAYKVTMYPVLFTFIPIYAFYLIRKYNIRKKTILTLSLVFLISYILFNIPQYITNTIGPTYGDFGANNNSLSLPSGKDVNRNNVINAFSKIDHLVNKFYTDFLKPKENGRYLIYHLEKDIEFFALNNIIILFGFVISTVYLFKYNKSLFFTVVLLFVTSFILWGNMDFYGGGSPDITTNLRNTHTRYMLPIIALFYILGFYYFTKIVKSKVLQISLLFFIVTRTFISLRSDYPFVPYSLVNKSGYVYDYMEEKDAILNLSIPKNALFISAAFDDYDLSYYFDNYANFKSIGNHPNIMESTLRTFLQNKNSKVYLLFPKNDSRFNPLSQRDLDSLYSYILSNYSSKVIFEDYYKKLLVIKNV